MTVLDEHPLQLPFNHFSEAIVTKPSVFYIAAVFHDRWSDTSFKQLFDLSQNRCQECECPEGRRLLCPLPTEKVAS
jgi:hypothetical protein